MITGVVDSEEVDVEEVVVLEVEEAEEVVIEDVEVLTKGEEEDSGVRINNIHSNCLNVKPWGSAPLCPNFPPCCPKIQTFCLLFFPTMSCLPFRSALCCTSFPEMSFLAHLSSAQDELL